MEDDIAGRVGSSEKTRAKNSSGLGKFGSKTASTSTSNELPSWFTKNCVKTSAELKDCIIPLTVREPATQETQRNPIELSEPGDDSMDFFFGRKSRYHSRLNRVSGIVTKATALFRVKDKMENTKAKVGCWPLGIIHRRNDINSKPSFPFPRPFNRLC
jgi:hypothetical protein